VSRSARLLSLLQALRGRRYPVTAAELARTLEVSERTIYRDVAQLAAQGAPIQGEGGVGYVLRPGLCLPPLMLSEDETEAVLLGLRYVDQRGDEVLTEAATSALAKISSVLSPAVQSVLTAPMTITGPNGFGFAKDIVPLSDLRTAIRSQLRLELAYTDGERRSTKRIVWPLQLGFMDSARVLVAWCELREDFRFFRTDRIQAVLAKERYPVRRVDLLRDLKVHLQKLDQQHP
jgi:predicted DNA-binding transcriptional regulator YafY